MKIDHFCIIVSDLQKSKDFYVNVFDAAVISENTLSGGWFDSVTGLKGAKAFNVVLELPFSGLKIELLKYAVPQLKIQNLEFFQIGFQHFAIAVESAHRFYDRLLKMKVATNSMPVNNQMGKIMFYFYGPDGEIWEIAEYIDDSKKSKLNKEAVVKIFCDGASRGNPGLAGAGYLILDEFNKELFSGKKFLGTNTNNVAEWQALILALEKAEEMGVHTVECFLDSKLVVEQASGNYKVKSPNLQRLFINFFNLKQKFKKLIFKHIPREKNFLADKLANQAIDQALIDRFN